MNYGKAFQAIIRRLIPNLGMIYINKKKHELR